MLVLIYNNVLNVFVLTIQVMFNKYIDKYFNVVQSFIL